VALAVPPARIRLPNAALLPITYAAEAVGRLTSRTTRVRWNPYVWRASACSSSSEKAVRELGYRWRAPAKAFEDAVLWLREQELL
jgi:dihydroflavonol-4-reductase